MNNHPLSDNYNQTLPFSPFVSGAGVDVGDASVSRRAVLWFSSKTSRQIEPTLDPALREAIDRPIIEPVVVSRYHVDVYGRPRILSKWEVILHALAWPVMFGVVIGYSLAISLVVMGNFSSERPQEKADQPYVTSLEVEP